MIALSDLDQVPGPGRARHLVSGLDHPEGVAWDPAEGCVYAGGEDGQIYRVEYHLHDGSGPEEVVRLHGHVPDGLAFTADGGLLISHYLPDRIHHLGADGRLEIVAQDPLGTMLAAPTNVAFAGPRLDRVVAANLGRWHLTLLDLGLIGAPLHRPMRWALDGGVATPASTRAG